MALCWILSSTSMSRLYQRAQNWVEYSRCGLASAEKMARIISVDLLTAFLLMQLRISLPTFAAKGKLLPFVQLGVHWAQASEKLFSRQRASIMLCTRGYSSSGTRLWNSIFWLHEALVSPFLPLLNGSKTCWCMSHSSQFCTTRKLAEGTVTQNPNYYWRQ